MAISRGGLREKTAALGQNSVSEIVEVFGKWIDPVNSLGQAIRERLFSPSAVFWLFLSQVLSENSSCREVHRKFLAWLACEKQEAASPNTAAYCKARAKLDQKAIEDINRQAVRKMDEGISDKDLWRGRIVKVVDGSGISMPDTEENQQTWPQPKGAKAGCSFPVMRIVAVFSLLTGALIACAENCLRVHERTLFRKLWNVFDLNDVVLADRGFCSFADFYLLRQRGVDCVMRNNQSRKAGVTEIKRFNKNDRLVLWHKTKICPNWLAKDQWQEFPDTIVVREITVNVNVPGFRTENIIIATTLLDPDIFSAADFAELYLRRWMVELFLRDIKTTMGMDVLKCKTPRMVRKELWMHIIAYNLIRSVMRNAAIIHDIACDRLSFKGTISTVRTWAGKMADTALSEEKRCCLYRMMLSYIACDPVPFRPNRVEPRAKKRRPKNYQLLNKPRCVFKEIYHRSKYIKP